MSLPLPRADVALQWARPEVRPAIVALGLARHEVRRANVPVSMPDVAFE